MELQEIEVFIEKDGRVRINGRLFEPEDDASDLNGMRFVFGLYYTGNVFQDFVSLWGTEAEFKTGPSYCGPMPHVVNGQLKWLWWKEVK